MPDELSEPAVRAVLDSGFITDLRYFDDIGSTNTEALEWAMQGAPEGALVITNHQTGGRGRWGRSWFSLPGKLLQFSLILRPTLELDRHGLLTGGLGVACAAGIGEATGLETKLKWPNDVVVQGRKIVGMLVEMQTMGYAISAAVCGIGVNVSLDEDDLPAEIADRASSIAIEMRRAGLGPVPPRVELLRAIIERIEAIYPTLVDRARNHEIVDAMTSRSIVLGEEVTLKRADGSTVSGRAERFDETGGLVLVAQDGSASTHNIGEIERLRSG